MAALESVNEILGLNRFLSLLPNIEVARAPLPLTNSLICFGLFFFNKFWMQSCEWLPSSKVARIFQGFFGIQLQKHLYFPRLFWQH